MVQGHSYTRLTLALDILGRIGSGAFAGYHELAVVKHRIGLHDTITIDSSPAMRVTCDSPGVPLDNSNICAQAALLLRKQYGVDSYVHIDIIKRIPVMGGLAGGSANAATCLELLAKHWQLDISTERFMELGRVLGMDVPYYFCAGTALDNETRGFPREIPTSLAFDFVLAIPPFGVSTREAYAQIDYSKTGLAQNATAGLCEALRNNSRTEISGTIHNDFELSVFARYPALADVRNRLLRAGCEAAWMSGSGSTVIGLTRGSVQSEQIAQEMLSTGLVTKALCACTRKPAV